MVKRLMAAAVDLEGTLVDIEKIHFLGLLAVARYLGLLYLGFTEDPQSFERVITGAIGGGDRFVISELLKLAGETPTKERVEELRLMKVEVVNSLLARRIVRPRPGSKAVIEMLRDELGVPIAVCSLTDEELAKTLFAKSGVGLWFPANHIVLQSDVKRLKPFPDAYIMAALKMGEEPSRIVSFEDSFSGVQAAVAAEKVVIDQSRVFVFEDSTVGASAARSAGSMVIGMPTPRNFRDKRYVAALKDAGAERVFGSWKDPELAHFLRELAS